MKNVVFVARLRAVDEQLQGGAGKKDSGVKNKKRNKSPTASKFTLYNQKSNRHNNSSNSNTTITTNSANNMNNNTNNNNKSTTTSTLNPNINYTFFTSNPTSDVLCISSKPINGKTICDNFHNKNDIFEFNKTILKDSSLLEYDYIYNETSPITKIYTEQIKDKITNLFHGYSSCILLYGPSSSGKSYLLRGNHIQQHHPTNNKTLTENSGLLLHAVHDLFGLLSLTKQTQTHYIIKISSYQIYMDTITDLLCKEKHTNQIKLEKYYDNNHNVNCAMIGLRKLIIRNQSDFELCLKEIIHQRKTISNTMNIKDMKRKSHFVISFTIEKRNVIINETTNKEENEIEMHSQIDFVELASSDYAFYGDNNNEDKSLDGIMCRNISKSFNSLCDAIVCASSGMSMKNETKLTLCLKNTIRYGSKIVFVNCIVPWEYPINESYKGVKFTNWLRNQVINVEGNRQCNKREYTSSYESNTIQSEGCVDVNNRKSMLNINDYNVNAGNISRRSGKDNAMQRRFNTLDSENKNISSIIMNPYDNVNTNSNSNNLRCFNGNNNNNSGLYRTTQTNDISFDPSIITSNPKHVKQLQNISNSLNQLNNKSLTLANTLKHETQQQQQHQSMQPQQQHHHQYQHSFNNNNTSFPDIDKIKIEYASLKSDNIIYKEDISRLTKTNNLLETELQLQRTRNIELTSTIEHLQSQLTSIESKHNIIQSKLENGTLIELDPSKTTSDTLYQALSSKLSLECKVKDLSNEITNLTESKQQLQVELSLLQERYDKLYQQYQCVLIDNKNVTCNYNMQYSSIEGKVNELMKEMERMKEENMQLKINEERLLRDKSDKDKEIEKIRRKYENELDNVNDLQIKLNGIKREYEKVIQEKENEEYLKMKENEYIQRKNESKLKAMNDLHNKISQYKSERLKKKQQQDEQEQDDDYNNNNTPTNTNIIVTE